MIVDLVRGLGAWAWVAGGLILLALEIAVPGNVLVWFGLAAVITGFVALFAAIGWQVQLVLFAALSLALVLGGRRVFARRAASDEPMLNRRADGLVGRTYVLSLPIVDGVGTVRINDANWRIRGPDLPSGSRVTVTGHDGAMLVVARAEG